MSAPPDAKVAELARRLADALDLRADLAGQPRPDICCELREIAADSDRIDSENQLD